MPHHSTAASNCIPPLDIIIFLHSPSMWSAVSAVIFGRRNHLSPSMTALFFRCRFPLRRSLSSSLVQNSNSSRSMYILSERDVRQALDPQQCLDVTRMALISLVDQTGMVPSRLALPYPHNPLKGTNAPTETTAAASAVAAEDWTLIKPAAYYGSSSDDDNTDDITMGIKVVSIRADNPTQGLPLVPATILLLDAASGLVNAVLAGTYITAMRTSAGPALAVQAFQPKVQHLVIFGAGAQAECHIRLMELAIQQQIPRITIVNRTVTRAEQLKETILEQRSHQVDTHPCQTACTIDTVELRDKQSLAEAMSTADVIAATTNTTNPLWDDDDNIQLKKGCLITGIGSYTPQMQEIPPSVVNRSVVIIDTPEALQVGDLKHLGVSTGSVDEKLSDLHKPVLMAGEALRKSPACIVELQGEENKDFIFYKAVGTAIQDVLQAEAVVTKAKEMGLGQNVDMT